MYIIMAILLLGIIIMLHELGHFLFAKSFGVGVIEFSIGMGPVVYWKRIKDTVYSIRLLPIGGYCAMYGENAPETADKGEKTDDKENEKKKKKERKPLIAPPEFKTDWKYEQSYKAIPKWQQLIILLAGPFTNIITGFIVALLSIMIFGGAVKPVITGFSDTVHVAEEAGLQIGDEIIAVDDENIITFQDYSLYTRCYKDKTQYGYNLTVKRENGDASNIITVRLVPDEETGLVGIMAANGLERKNFLDTIKYAGNQSVYWIKATAASFHMVASGTVQLSQFTGIVGTTAIMNNTLEDADTTAGSVGVIRTLFALFIFVSTNLGLMNLLPLPALDGGRALITWIEGAFEKTVPEKVEYALNAMGMLFILFLMGATFINDIINLVMK